MSQIGKIMDAVEEAYSYYRHSVEKLEDLHAIGVILENAGKKLQKLNMKDFDSEYGR